MADHTLSSRQLGKCGHAGCKFLLIREKVFAASIANMQRVRRLVKGKWVQVRTSRLRVI